MPINHIIADWNGTLFQDKSEGKLWEYVGMSALKNSGIGSIPTPTTFKLCAAMIRLKSLVKRYRHGEIGYDAIYKAFNERVLYMVPPAIVREWVNNYAISTILAVRNAVNDHEPLYPFYELIANPLLATGRGSKTGSAFHLGIYTAADKLEKLKHDLPHYEPHSTLYMTDGDDADGSGEQCIEYVKDRNGKIAVPFFQNQSKIF